MDRRWGEPPAAVHPVALFGRLMTAVEERLYRDNRAAGAAFLGLGVTMGVASGRVLERCLGPAGVALACAAASASRMLADSALDVARALARDDLDEARDLVQALVGRDPRGLDSAEIARAVVESVAENSVDAVLAPVFWAALAGAPGVLAHRAVNTLDAMVGHRSSRYHRFGWASARLDDLAAWVPARVGALTVAAVRPRQARMVWKAVREQAPAHPSPNSGVAEAAFAAALGRRLGGTNRYGERVECRQVVGFGPPVGVGDIEQATDLLRDVSRALMGFLLASGALGLVSRKSRVGRRLRRTWLPPLGSPPSGWWPCRAGTR
jgi:adenosylcobinamide-phosphate synthase